jgi:hypothetical protein
VTFTYSATGRTAQDILESWTKHFRILPTESCEPDRAAHLLSEYIRQRPTLSITVPVCPIHRAQMVMLGSLDLEKPAEYGDENYVRHSYIHRLGLFRCPTPGCPRVDKLPDEDKVTLCPKCKEPTDAPLSSRGAGYMMCYACRRSYNGRWNRAQKRAVHAGS